MSEGPNEDTVRFIRPKDLDNEERATLAARIGWRIEALLWDALYWYPMKLLPVERASNAMGAVVKTLGPLLSQNRTLMRNLRMCFPELGEERLKEIGKGAWRTLGRTVGEMPHLAKFRPDIQTPRLEVAGTEQLDALRKSGKPAVFISGHFANWEVIGAAISASWREALITYRAANNPHIDRRIAAARRAYGTNTLTPKGAGTRDLMRSLLRGHAVGLMNDQKFNQGIAVPFFGYPAMTAPGPARLARKFKAPLIPISCVRTGPARYRVTFHPPIEHDPDPDEEQAVTNTVQRVNDFVEARIREKPEEWFWMHNRWPKEAWVEAGVIPGR